jgi:hypothetical protein
MRELREAIAAGQLTEYVVRFEAERRGEAPAARIAG